MTMKGVRIVFEVGIDELLTALAKIDSGRKMKVEPIYKAAEQFDPVAFQSLQALPAPVQSQAVKDYKKTRRLNRNGRAPSRQLILQALASGKPLTVKEMVAIAEANGNTKSAASVGLDWMQKRKWVKRIASGTWQITSLGKQNARSE